jgi:hypothetical protein
MVPKALLSGGGAPCYTEIDDQYNRASLQV